MYILENWNFRPGVARGLSKCLNVEKLTLTSTNCMKNMIPSSQMGEGRITLPGWQRWPLSFKQLRLFLLKYIFLDVAFNVWQQGPGAEPQTSCQVVIFKWVKLYRELGEQSWTCWTVTVIQYVESQKVNMVLTSQSELSTLNVFNLWYFSKFHFISHKEILCI